MPNRTLVWVLITLAVVLVVVPVVGMIGMMSIGWMGGHMMIGMGAFGLVWTLLAVIVIVAVISLLVSDVRRT